VGSNTDGNNVRSVGNSLILKETALIEAFNLKAAIEFELKSIENAQEALSDMPPRQEGELDPVTLHNQSLMHMDTDVNGSFRKLNFLLNNPPFPPEVFGNLLILHCKHQHYDVAADLLAENAHLTYKLLHPDLYDFLIALVGVELSPEEAYRNLDILTGKHTERLRKHTKSIQDARVASDSTRLKDALEEYDQALERFIPVHMAMAKIYWDRENYPKCEAIFKESHEFCSDNEVWKLNLAHVLFMQESSVNSRYKDAIQYYEPAVQKYSDSILDITAVVLANLCVAYIMTSQNDKAEDLMRQIEKEEERLSFDDPDSQCFHLCIVNLVIGTLYCAKGNFEFGISRIIKSLEPYKKKLGADTWFYAKRCFLALAEVQAKHMITLKDGSIHDILTFLDAADQHGKNILTVVNHGAGDDDKTDATKHNVSFEARQLKKLFLKLAG